jgi:membrane-bound lytic murein transglycosylase D
VADPAYAYEQVEAPPGTALATIARAAGVRVETIEALNPELVRDRTPPDRGPSRVRVPPGTAAAYASAFESLRAGSDRTETIVLRFGETLEDVAKGRGVNARDLRKLNGVKDSSELRAGMSIVVPRRGPAPAKAKARDKGEAVAEEAGKSAAPGSDARSEDEPADDLTIVAVPDRAFAYDGRERVFYKTRDADGLDEIAATFGVRSEELTEWNNLDPTAKLQPRMVLQIFVRKDFDPVGVLLLDPGRVRVVTLGSEEFLELETARKGKKRLTVTAKAGDTLAKLGRRYGLTPGDLARINRFSYNTELHEGQRIVVYSPTGDAPREVTMGLTPAPLRPKGGAPAGKPGTKMAVKSPAAAGAKAPVKPGAPAAKPAAAAASTGKAAPARAAAKAPPPPPPAATTKKK